MEGLDVDRIVGRALAGGFVAIVLVLGLWLWDLAKRAGKRGLDVSRDIIEHARDRKDGVPDSAGRYDSLYEKAYEEVNSTARNAASWGKALSNSAGDNEKAKALYIKYRVEQLKHRKMD